MQSYSTAIQKTVADIFDEELIIAHYGSGLYYSISSTGSLIWQALRSGMTDESVIAWLAGQFPKDAAAIDPMVRAFVTRLLEEGLIVPIGSSPAKPPPALPEVDRLGAPILQRYDDLQELLLLDPVHDVEDAGWPHRAEK
jgi:Coenzyme PQQ synthesis protein D (PqqD)